MFFSGFLFQDVVTSCSVLDFVQQLLTVGYPCSCDDDYFVLLLSVCVHLSTCQVFLDFRVEVVERRANHALKKAQQRKHLVEVRVECSGKQPDCSHTTTHTSLLSAITRSLLSILSLFLASFLDDVLTFATLFSPYCTFSFFFFFCLLFHSPSLSYSVMKFAALLIFYSFS